MVPFTSSSLIGLLSMTCSCCKCQTCLTFLLGTLAVLLYTTPVIAVIYLPLAIIYYFIQKYYRQVAFLCLSSLYVSLCFTLLLSALCLLCSLLLFSTPHSLFPPQTNLSRTETTRFDFSFSYLCSFFGKHKVRLCNVTWLFDCARGLIMCCISAAEWQPFGHLEWKTDFSRIISWSCILIKRYCLTRTHTLSSFHSSWHWFMFYYLGFFLHERC